jgi:ATP-dependent DNA helicase RecG
MSAVGSVMGVFRDLVEVRARLADEVASVLDGIQRGEAPRRPESEHVDCKEEPGRRGRGGVLLPAEAQNNAAAEYLAREVCCTANTPGGGALILGIADGLWHVLGTGLDADWLRHRIYQLADVAPAVEEREVAGQRVLVIFVAESPEPVEDPDGKIRWRVDTACAPVDRAEWWLHRQQRAGLDVMAAATARTAADATPGALATARRYLREGGDPDLAGTPSATELLRRLGVLFPDGHLTQAGVLMFVAAGRPLLTLARLDVPGGEVVGRFEPEEELALIEQIADAEARLDAYNPVNPVSRGLAEAPVRSLPVRTVREAVLNGLAHRDWMSTEQTAITWTEVDSRLEVVSPGGFSGGVTADNLLTQRYARYPALSDLFRALRLVDRQGVGVDRMYREMIVLGHRPPSISEQPGPRVRTVLTGGPPVVPVVGLVESIRPEVRQRDVRIAVLIHELLHRPFLSIAQAATALQSDEWDAESALEAAEQSTVDGDPLVRAYKDVFLLGDAAIARVERGGTPPDQLARRGILTYRRPGAERTRDLVMQWLATHDRITSGDYSAMTGTARPNATRVLNGLVGDLLNRGVEARGRNAHFTLRRPVG